MTQMRVSGILILLGLCGALHAQTAPSVNPQHDKEQRISTLKKEIHAITNPERKDDFENRQVLLAELGEPEQLQQILCELDYGDPPAVQVNAAGKLTSIGGWFSILAASRLLIDDPKYKRGTSDVWGMYPSMREIALNTLPHLVSNPPLGEVRTGFGPSDHSKEVSIWMEWLEKNHDSLRKLQPAGDDLQVSKSVCRNVLRNDLVAKYYRIRVKPQKGRVSLN